MSELHIGKGSSAGAFSPRTMALIVAIGILAFIGMMVLGAYAPDLRSGRNGGAHALSNAATGFSGIVRMTEATGHETQIVRHKHGYLSQTLLVITPESGRTNISAPLREREKWPTLFVFPKWNAVADPDHRGWVLHSGILPRWEPEGVLAPGFNLKIERRRSGGKPLRIAPELPADISFRAPRPLQVITNSRSATMRGKSGKKVKLRLHPLITDDKGGIVLARLGDRPLYVLADPDILSNKGMKRLDQARSAVMLLDSLNTRGSRSIGFDVTMNGLGHSQSPLKLIFEPPFLAMTLAIMTALLLAGVYALGRFGAARRRERAIAFGKAALVDNSAAMIRKAGREARMGLPYVSVIRERAAASFGVPARLRDDALDAYLDGLKGGDRFTDLARDAANAANRSELVEAARALHRWEKEKNR